MKNITLVVATLLCASLLSGCGATGKYVKKGNKTYGFGGAQKYAGDNYIRAIASAGGMKDDTGSRTDSDTGEQAKEKFDTQTTIRMCMANAKAEVGRAIINQVIEGVQDAAVKTKGAKFADAETSVRNLLPALETEEIYTIIGDNCYANENVKFVEDLQKQANCSCEYAGAIEKTKITGRLRTKYDNEITSMVEKWLLSHNELIK